MFAVSIVIVSFAYINNYKYLFIYSPNVPRDYIDIQGAVVLLSVFDYDKIGNDDFAGEVLIRLSSIPKISMSQTVDSASVVMMALQRPSASLEGPFQVRLFIYLFRFCFSNINI